MYAGDTAGAPVDTTYSQASAAATDSVVKRDMREKRMTRHKREMKLTLTLPGMC